MAIVLCGIHSCVGAPSVVCLPWENWHRSDCRRGPLSGHVPSPILYDYVARTKHQLLPATGTMRILQFYAKLYIPSTIKIWRKLPSTVIWADNKPERPPSAMKGIGYFQNLRNFWEIFWKFFGFFWEFIGNFLGGFF